jgi:hypothetical protein
MAILLLAVFTLIQLNVQGILKNRKTMEMLNEDNFESTIKRYKEASDNALENVLEYCMHKSKEELISEFEIWDNDLLHFISKSALKIENFEICSAVKEVFNKRK